MNVHMMIDAETFGVGPFPVFAQVGLVVFDHDTGEVIDKAEWNINIDSCTRLGAKVDDSTIRWWMTRPDAMRRAVADVPEHGRLYAMEEVLNAIKFNWTHHACRRVWSHGATFDVGRLETYFRAAGMTQPWHYGDARDTRTRFEDAERLVGWSREKVEVAHGGLADSLQQVKDLMSAWAALVERTKAATPAEKLDEPPAHVQV